MANTPYLIGTGSEASGGSGIITVTAGVNTGAGDSIIVGIGTTATTNDAVSVTDTQNNAYTEIEGPTGGTLVSGSTWQSDGAAPLTSGVDQIIVTLPGTAPTVVIAVGDNGVGITVTAEDQNVSATGNNASPNSSLTSTLDQTYEHAIAFIVDLAAGGVPSWSSPWNANVLANVEDSGAAIRISAAYQDVTSTTALEATATITSSRWTCMLATNNVTNLQIQNSTIPTGIVELPYTVTFSTIGGIGAITYSVSGTLPPGLTLTNGVLSGTPVSAGTYTFTITASAATFGPSTSQSYSLVILPAAASGAPQATLYGNLLSTADSNCATGFTWAAFSNASAVSLTNRQALSGNDSLFWTALAGGTTSIRTASYTLPQNPPSENNIQENMSYVVSAAMLPLGGVRNLYIGVRWLTATGGFLGYSGGPLILNPSPIISQGAFWTPVYCLATAPPTAATAQIVAWCDSTSSQNVLAGEMVLIDQVFFAQSNAQVMVDFQNPAFLNSGNGAALVLPLAGAAFMDLTPWVRKDVGVNYTRGRQDAISEVQAGSAAFTLQNDQGTFTRFNSSSFLNAMGPSGASPSLQQRMQINLSDGLGNWYTRYDGLVSEIDYTFDNTGNTCIADFSCTDVLGYLNREPALLCWTYEEILSCNPLYFWPLNDYDQVQAIVSFDQNTLQQTVNISTNGFSVASEVAGFNGPPMRISDRAPVIFSSSAINWADTTYGVETLGDAVAPNALDGSEYWSAGNDQPSTAIRGLDSGVTGPFSTPLPNVLLSPTISIGTIKNGWVNNQGLQLVANLSASQALSTNTQSFSVEIYFMSAPGLVIPVSGIANTPLWSQNTGPFICLGIGNSRNLNNVAAGIFIGNSTATFEVNTYTNPPAWGIRSFPSSAPIGPTGSISQAYTPDSSGCPHHLVLTFQGGGGTRSGATITAFLDGAQMPGTITLPPNMLYDTISAGGPHGGAGNWYGSLSCCVVYPYILSQSQIAEHCQRGQYGAWEEATDQCIAELLEYANVPPFWVNVQASDTIGASNALSLTDYTDITGQNALSAMQLYETTENGLLFVNSMGQMTILTRDWKMGYGGPDLYLPSDTFDGSSIGYEVVDQYQMNEMSISSITFPTGGSYVNQQSIPFYGTYSSNPVGSPLQLPIITFSRGFSMLGVASLTYYAEPNISDLCAWMATTRANPYLTAASVTVDLLTLDTQSNLSLADFYNLEIGMMIAPNGGVPQSFPNSALSSTWFIEGITETVTDVAHTIQFFTSPASVQEAWIPGDPIYGVLGETTTLGVSAVDTNAPQADGKDVSHDAGPPYWPPTFSDNVYYDDTILLTPVVYFPLDGPTAQDFSGNGFNATPTNSNCATFAYPSSPIAGAGSSVEMFAAASGALVSTYSPSGGSEWTIECWVNLNNMPTNSVLNPNPRVFASSHTNSDNGGFEISLTNGLTPKFAIGNGTTHVAINATTPINTSGWNSLILTWDGVAGVVTAYVNFVAIGTATLLGTLGASTGHVTIGAGTYNGDYLNGLVGQCAIYQQALPTVDTRQEDSTSPGMNNPAANGNFFIGNNDMRGIVWSLQKMLTPPMCVVGQQTQSPKYAEGALPDPTVPWDTVYVDTEGGMGLVAAWPNWYVVTVPGFYEIDAVVETSVSAINDSAQAWIIVAEEAAQQLQAQAGSPVNNFRYVCPVGETKRLLGVTGAGNSVNLCPSWRGYLGLGDMVAIGFEHNVGSTNVPLVNNTTGSWFSIRWTGLSNTGDDRAQVCSTINGGTIVNPGGFVTTQTTSWTNTGCYTYRNYPPHPGNIVSSFTNSRAWQGNNTPPSGAMQYAQLLFNFSQINNTLSGAEILSATITATNSVTHTRQSGSTLIAQLGLFYGPAGKSPWSPIFSGGGQDAIGNLCTPAWKYGKKMTFTLPSTFFGAFGGQGYVATILNGNKCSGILLGNDSFTSSQYNGSFLGAPGSWTLTVQYKA